MHITTTATIRVFTVATVTLSDYNVRINIPSVTDKAAGRDIKQSSADDLKCAKRIHAEIEEAAKQYLL